MAPSEIGEPARTASDHTEVIDPAMRIPTWRLVLTGVAIVVLAGAGVGLALAASQPAVPAPAAPAAAPGASQGATNELANHPVLQQILQRLANRPALRRLVDGQLTLTDKNGALVTVQLDHGTIDSIGGGTLTIDEADGRKVTVSTDADTIVRLGGGAGLGRLGDLRAGDEVFVQSRIGAGTTLAKHIQRVPAGSTTTAVPGASASPTSGG